MSVSKTRQKLVDVARQLFAKNGIANTTMNDIAVASGKGRRTLYTYFSRKEDVYYAVIESELERLSDKLDEVANCKMRPQDKIIEKHQMAILSPENVTVSYSRASSLHDIPKPHTHLLIHPLPPLLPGESACHPLE